MKKEKELLRKIRAGEELTEAEEKETEETILEVSEEILLLREIRDSLQKDKAVQKSN